MLPLALKVTERNLKGKPLSLSQKLEVCLFNYRERQMSEWITTVQWRPVAHEEADVLV